MFQVLLFKNSHKAYTSQKRQDLKVLTRCLPVLLSCLLPFPLPQVLPSLCLPRNLKWDIDEIKIQ